MGSWSADLPITKLRYPENATVKDWIIWVISQDNSSRRDPNIVMVDIEQAADIDPFTQAKITRLVLTVQFKKDELPVSTINRILSTMETATGQRFTDYSIVFSRNTNSLYLIGRTFTKLKDGIDGKW